MKIRKGNGKYIEYIRRFQSDFRIPEQSSAAVNAWILAGFWFQIHPESFP